MEIHEIGDGGIVSGTWEELQQYMSEAEAAAIANALPINREVVWGSFWWRYLPTEDLFIFGEVYAEDHTDKWNRAHGVSAAENAYEIKAQRNAYERGYRFGRCYSVWEPSGELGSTHISEMFPMTEEEFNAAREANWQVLDDERVMADWFRPCYLRCRARYMRESGQA